MERIEYGHVPMIEGAPLPDAAVVRDDAGEQIATAAELDISGMSADELRDLAARLRREAERRKDQERAVYAVAIRDQIRAAGYTLSELGLQSVKMSERKHRPVRDPSSRPSMAGHLPPKYRDPGSDRTWVGKGQPPKWFRAALAAGVTREAMLIGGAL